MVFFCSNAEVLFFALTARFVWICYLRYTYIDISSYIVCQFVVDHMYSIHTYV